MKAIILSAGQGTRLLPLTRNRPKCLLEVEPGVTVLGWQLEQLAKAGITEAVVVTGYRAAMVNREVLAHRPHIQARTLFNPHFDQLDNLGSVNRASAEMDGDFIIINGDTLFTAAVGRRLCAAKSADIRVTISHKSEYDEDDMKVILHSGQLTAVGKQLRSPGVNAESIGMILFRGQGPRRFREAVGRALADRHVARQQNYLAVINDLAQVQPLEVLAIDRDAWCEVDFPEDLQTARDAVRRWKANGHKSDAFDANGMELTDLKAALSV